MIIENVPAKCPLWDIKFQWKPHSVGYICTFLQFVFFVFVFVLVGGGFLCCFVLFCFLFFFSNINVSGSLLAANSVSGLKDTLISEILKLCRCLCSAVWGPPQEKSSCLHLSLEDHWSTIELNTDTGRSKKRLVVISHEGWLRHIDIKRSLIWLLVLYTWKMIIRLDPGNSNVQS